MQLHRASFVPLVVALVTTLWAPCTAAQSIVLTSGSFQPGGPIGRHYAATFCGGDNFSPSLHWRGAPPLTRSLLLTVHDPQGRGGAGLWHWIVFDIPATVSGLPSLRSGLPLPAGAKTATNGHGARGYSGPCPPQGERHRYTFTLYALDESFVQEETSVGPRTLLGAISSHVLATGTLAGTYPR